MLVDAKTLLGVVSQEINFSQFEKVIRYCYHSSRLLWHSLNQMQFPRLNIFLKDWSCGIKEMIKLELYLVDIKEDYDC